jgi:glutamate-1-semialdehyde 2,1-aminomutase
LKNYTLSETYYHRACQCLPGGVNSPVRSFKAVGGCPIFIDRAGGSRLYDVDGNEFIDYVCSWGPLILGHAAPSVVEAVGKAARNGTSYGAPHLREIELAEMICDAMPSLEMLRFVNSGTEAVMSALRAARAYTGRNKILKFEGCYHGHADGLLVKSGSGLATLGLPASPGVPADYTALTLSAPYNNLEAAAALFERYPQEIAAVIVEPAAANMGLVLAVPGFLAGLRELTRHYGALLIFDEVICGFRVAWGGAQSLFKIQPDLTCLSKIIGGGLPVGAYGGRRDIMQMIAPAGPVYQAGTLSGNPLAMAAGLATLKELTRPDFYDLLDKRTSRLAEGIRKAATTSGVKLQLTRLGSLLTVFFCQNEVRDYTSAGRCDSALFARFFHGLLERGIYWPPSQFESTFISSAHSEADIDRTVNAIGEVFVEIGAGE